MINDTLVIRVGSGNVATLGRCHGSHGKDRRDKYNDKYIGERQRQKCWRIQGKYQFPLVTTGSLVMMLSPTTKIFIASFWRFLKPGKPIPLGSITM